MAPDILDHRPARPDTIYPGHWIIDLPANATIHIKRFRARPHSGQKGVDDSIEIAWKAINSHTPRAGANIKDILWNGCGTVVAGQTGRQLWCFTSNTEGPPTETYNLEPILPDLEALDPSQLLSCPRHGHERSCLSRPSTSQRPLKSCDVRFQPQGQDKEIWEKLGQSIYERAEWAKGRRVMANQMSEIEIGLFPEPNGLLLRLQPSRRPRPSQIPSPTEQFITVTPLGLRAIIVGPYQPTPAEANMLSNSFELALGQGWKDRQGADRLEAQLANRIYHDYTTLWVPDPHVSRVDGTSSPKSVATTDSKGLLAVWPTHLVSRQTPSETGSRPIRPSSHTSAELHLDLLNSAATLFDTASTYREPIQEMTPPEDASLEDDHALLIQNEPVSPLASSEKGTGSLHTGNEDPDDDLEDLFASRPGSPGAFDSEEGQFEMFGEQDIRTGSRHNNNAHMIDYDDVVMSSPPIEAAPERRTSVREVMGEEEGGDEAGIANVTEDDFNFFDSPAPEEEGTPAEVAEPVEAAKSSPPQEVDQAGGLDVPADIIEGEGSPEPSPVAEAEAQVDPPSGSVDLALHHDTPQQTAQAELDTPVLVLPIIDAEKEASDSTAPIMSDTARHQKAVLVPDTFAPLVLSSFHTTFKYSLPTPAPTPPDMNDDLVARIRNDINTSKSYDYTLAWRLGTPDSTAEIEEYTGPPTPISELDEFEVPPEKPVTADQAGNSDRTDGQLEYDGVPCVGAALVSFVSRNQWAESELTSWKSSWDSEPIRAAKEKEVLASPLVPTSKKRKRPSEEDWGKVDLESLAKQIIGDRAFRQFLNPNRARSTSRNPPEMATSRDGVPLAEMTTRDSGTEETPGELVATALSPCTIHIGYHGRVAQMSVAALRYWPELGLQPLSGPKNFKAVIINIYGHEAHYVRRIVNELGETYTALHLGTIEWPTDLDEHGMFSLAQVEKSHFTQDLSTQCGDGNSVIFVLMPMDSPVPMSRVLVSLQAKSPRNRIVHYLSLSTESRSLANIARDIYDRLPRQLRVVHPTEDQPPWYHYPSFTLAPAEPRKPHLTLQWPIKSFDVLGAGRWVHAAYAVDQITDSIVVFVVDTEGDNWDVRVIQDAGIGWAGRIEAVWEFVTTFAAAAAIEWRVSISSLGCMDSPEVEAWQDLFIARSEPISVIICDPASPSPAESSRPRPVPPNVPPGIINDSTTSIIDESLSATHTTMATRQPISCGETTIYSDTSFLLSLSSPSLEYDTSTYHILCHRPPPGKEEEETEKEMATEMYRSACWARMKFGMEELPAALAAVRAVCDGLGSVRRSQE